MDKRIIILLLVLFTLRQSDAWSFWKSTEQKQTQTIINHKKLTQQTISHQLKIKWITSIVRW
jgi:hypothetical protein